MLYSSKQRFFEAKRKIVLGERLLRSDSNDIDILLVRYNHPISNAQLYPLVSSYTGSKRSILEIQIEDLDNPRLLSKLSQMRHVSLVGIQAHWDLNTQDQHRILKLKEIFTYSKFISFDWYAPLHIPQKFLLEHCDIYVKKQNPMDISSYSRVTNDTNLCEYEANNWGRQYASTKFLKADSELISKKLHLGWNFATDQRLISLLRKNIKIDRKRQFDLHCRIFAPAERDTWYLHMRGRAFDAVQHLSRTLSSEKILCQNKPVSFSDYINELSDSVACFSPFGYGEVCWRDFEAILAGAVLIKPDMSHLNTAPNVYESYVTYLPVKWDFSDFIDRYLWLKNNPQLVKEMQSEARKRWLDYLEFGWPAAWTELQSKTGSNLLDCASL